MTVPDGLGSDVQNYLTVPDIVSAPALQLHVDCSIYVT